MQTTGDSDNLKVGISNANGRQNDGKLSKWTYQEQEENGFWYFCKQYLKTKKKQEKKEVKNDTARKYG